MCNKAHPWWRRRLMHFWGKNLHPNAYWVGFTGVKQWEGWKITPTPIYTC